MTNEYEYEGDELALFSKAVNWKKYVAKITAPYIKGDVAEVGAGTGNFTTYLYGKAIQSWVMIEPDRKNANTLQQKIDSKELPGSVVINTTMTEVPDTYRFDTILYMDVLEHIKDDRDEVSTMIHHLKPGGHIIILSPAFQFLYTPFDKAIGHYRRYNKKEVKQLFEDPSGTVVCRYLDSVGVLTSLANKLILKQQYPTMAQISTWDKYIIPLSKKTDHLLGHLWGRSVLLIWRKKELS